METKTDTSIFFLSDAARAFNKEGNRKLLVRLLKFRKIAHTKHGGRIILDKKGMDALGKAVHEWDSRMRLSEIA